MPRSGAIIVDFFSQCVENSLVFPPLSDSTITCYWSRISPPFPPTCYNNIKFIIYLLIFFVWSIRNCIDSNSYSPLTPSLSPSVPPTATKRSTPLSSIEINARGTHMPPDPSYAHPIGFLHGFLHSIQGITFNGGCSCSFHGFFSCSNLWIWMDPRAPNETAAMVLFKFDTGSLRGDWDSHIKFLFITWLPVG